MCATAASASILTNNDNAGSMISSGLAQCFIAGRLC